MEKLVRAYARKEGAIGAFRHGTHKITLPPNGAADAIYLIDALRQQHGLETNHVHIDKTERCPCGNRAGVPCIACEQWY